MHPPLLEVVLLLHFDPVALPEERLQYFTRVNADRISATKQSGKDGRAWISPEGSTTLLLTPSWLELRSTLGQSFPRLCPGWTPLIDSFLDVFSISSLSQVSLSYLNEIPLQELKEFGSYLNTGFEMPSLLKEKFELFRSEFTFKYDFGEIKVRLQPEWDENMEGYAVQLAIESRCSEVEIEQVYSVIDQLHEGNKEVFHQILSLEYIRQLPQ